MHRIEGVRATYSDPGTFSIHGDEPKVRPYFAGMINIKRDKFHFYYPFLDEDTNKKSNQ